jgi:hypothetical protein
MRSLGRVVILACIACASPAQAADVYLFDAMKKPAYARALASLLEGRQSLPSWTQNLLSPRGDYVGTPAEYGSIEGDPFEVFSACKAHECDTNRAVVMFFANGTRAWAGVYVAGKPIIWLGAPDPSRQAAMTRRLQP